MSDKEPLLQTSLQSAVSSDDGNHGNQDGKQTLSGSVSNWLRSLYAREDVRKHDQLVDNTEADDVDENSLMGIIQLVLR
ncbi:unnamed protein product [Adineta ricciae]|uniref:Uncharacterized protein n=1 Tax=Adineta ricciae TaxID=249248 RepID=A0A815M8R9_ADIRI|nr:unnamed protein product [Adineta ricciae]CAF1656803.1 unnamed protein product [Adineta ricciae]